MIMMMFFLFSSCAVNGGKTVPGTDIEIPPANKNIYDLVTVIYTDQEIEMLSRYHGNIQQLNIDYPIECVREQVGFYLVEYCGEGQIVALWFDDSGKNEYDWGGFIYSATVPKKMFDCLKVGLTLSDVKAIDPEGCYIFEEGGVPHPYSLHHSSDGYMYVITYDEVNLNVIEDISISLY